ncbi:MAG: signal peptidase I [Oscillospiraceae bacterium]|nr:signal peptidase I [Oscillospiraceae bacterium]
MKERKFKKELLNLFRTVVIAVIFGLFIQSTITTSAHVISGSMEDTIMTDSRVMGLRVSYLFCEPERFDIIIFQPTEGDQSIPHIKRIIGLPNEEIRIVDGRVFINGSTVPLDEDFIKGISQGNFGPFNVPENSYFVMGDNRNGSSDSRHWHNRYVPRGNIIGKLYFSYFPIPHLLG